ncbi:uncharacterized protein LOC126750111 [Anthonomus grandis grandis]|uniref:uncharacterized protein LOC126750111 n=1 Tax=Anthonomus grandis grandis TaxID=2921223 RepID=UPI002164FA8D|nr:uncharacterized protein LOC126750111 [Anthonomus grandis grandis]
MKWAVRNDTLAGQVSDDELTGTSSDLQKTLTKFWEVEEVSVSKALSKEEIDCANIFVRTTRRNSEGRFIVTLPLKQDESTLGKSREQVEKRFYSTERRLSKNNKLRDYYVYFMPEYEELNHMSKTESCDNSHIEYFMSHHGVLREPSLTTKLRIVFDASCQQQLVTG